MSIFSERLKKTLEYKNMSQNKLAKDINCSQALINKFCLGTREPNMQALVSICKALNESSDYLLGLDDNERI